MKKTLALILALAMLMSFAACGNNNEPATEPENTPDEPAIDEPATMPGDNDTDADTSSTDTDLPEEELPSTDTDLPEAGDNKPLELLSGIWAAYPAEQKFAAMGGDAMNNVMDAPGACDVSDTETMDALFGLPAASAGNVAAAASLMHMMNANTFTSACYQLADGADVDAFVEDCKANILARQWMCGFPDTLIIADLEGCIVTAFGNGEVIDLFKQMLETEGKATILVEEPIA